MKTFEVTLTLTARVKAKTHAEAENLVMDVIDNELMTGPVLGVTYTMSADNPVSEVVDEPQEMEGEQK